MSVLSPHQRSSSHQQAENNRRTQLVKIRRTTFFSQPKTYLLYNSVCKAQKGWKDCNTQKTVKSVVKLYLLEILGNLHP